MQQRTYKPMCKRLGILQIANRVTKIICWGLLTSCFSLALCFSSATQVFAQSNDPFDAEDTSSIQRVEETKATKGKGWQISTKGGIKFINPSDERYWCAIGGTIRLDQVFYSGSQLDKQGQFPNSGFIRRVEPGIDGGIGQDWEFSASVAISTLGTSNGVVNGIHGRMSETWIGYTGFSKNSELFFGRMSGNWFGLENSTGSGWMAFMERSAQANLFYPGDGIGLMGDMWWNDGAITVLLLEHDPGDHIFTSDFNRPRLFRSDRLKAIARATYAPVHCLGDVWHFGVSGYHSRLDAILWDIPVNNPFFGIPPAGFAQRNRANILGPDPFPATYLAAWNVEAARQCGPFIAEAEYTQVFVHQVGNPFQTSLQFRGWNLQTRYLLTGEAHSYDVRDGSFGSFDICSPYGALEAALRYDYVNVNDKNIHGGSQHNLTFGLNWFINSQVRVTGNYVRSSFRPRASLLNPNQALHRKLNAFGFRIQVRFK